MPTSLWRNEQPSGVPLSGERTAQSNFGLAKLYAHTGKREQAQEHLTTATTMYRETGMTYWLEQAETELRQFA